MDDMIKKRVLDAAYIMLEDGLTVREVAKIIGISKSTVHKDLTQKLSLIDKYLFEEISDILEYHKKIRHIRGGLKTKEKYALLKAS